MEGVMKRFGLILLSVALIFAISGCDDDSNGKKNGGTEDDNPVINGISYTKTGGAPTAITAGATINIDYNEEITLIANVDNGDTFSWVSATAGIVQIVNSALSTTVIKGVAVNGGETEITFTANNGSLKDEFKFKIKVEEMPAEGFFFSLKKGEDPLTDGDDIPMTTLDAPITITATVFEDGDDVSDSADITWDVDDDIVTLSSTTGNSINITPIKAGTATITVTGTPDNDDDYEPIIIEFTVTVTKAYGENVLFEWSHEEFPLTDGESLAQNFTWTHPDANKFRDQPGLVRVNEVKLLGGAGSSAGYNSKGFQLGTPSANNTRFIIGKTNTAGTNAEQTYIQAFPGTGTLGGQIDLYRKEARLTIGYADASNPTGGTNWVLRVAVNDSTANLASMYGSAGVLATYLTIADLENAATGNTATAGTITIDIDTTTGLLFDHVNEPGLARAFIGLHTQQSGSLTITSLKLEYVSGAPAGGTPVTLAIQDDGVAIAQSVSLEEGETLDLTAVAPEADTITWTSSDDEIVLINDGVSHIGETATLEALEAGFAQITVIAEKAGTIPAIKIFDVQVTAAGDIIPTGVLWEWVYNGTNGPGTLAVANLSYLAGTGSHPLAAEMPIRISHTNVSYAPEQGIIIDGSINTSGSVLIIGSEIRAAGGTSGTDSFPSTGTFAPEGVFDFRTGNLNGIKITLGMEIMEDGINRGANRGFGVIINNNTTTAANTPLGADGRIALWNVPNAAGTGLGSGTAYNTSTKIYTCNTFTPSRFTQTYIETLEKAFVGISQLGRSAGTGGDNMGAKILLTSIRIEYVEAP